MAERVNSLAGELDVENAPSEGTTVVAGVPLNGWELLAKTRET